MREVQLYLSPQIKIIKIMINNSMLWRKKKHHPFFPYDDAATPELAFE